MIYSPDFLLWLGVGEGSGNGDELQGWKELRRPALASLPDGPCLGSGQAVLPAFAF